MGSDKNTFTYWQMQCREADSEWADYPSPKKHMFGRRKDIERVLKGTMSTPGFDRWQWRIVETDRDGNQNEDSEHA